MQPSKTTKSKQKRILWGLVAFLLIFVLVCREREMKVMEAKWEDGKIYVSWWDKEAPRVRLTVDCIESKQECSIRAYHSYWPWQFWSVKRDEYISVDKKIAGFRLIVANLELDSDK